MAQGSILQRGIVIVFVGLTAGAVHSALRPLTPPKVEVTPGDVVPVTPPDPAAPKNGQEIDLVKAWELFQSGSPFADARSIEDYEKGHVEGAFWMTTEQFMNGNTPAALQFLDKSQWLIIYCSGGDCDASHNLAQFLGLVGYNKCLIMKDGYPAWAEASHPTATGKPEIGAP